VQFQPGHALGVQVVGGFVKQQDVRRLQQQAAEGHAAALTTGEHIDLGIRLRAAQRIHGDVQLLVDVPGIARLDLVLQHGLDAR
jgi:hypothetical protein